MAVIESVGRKRNVHGVRVKSGRHLVEKGLGYYVAFNNCQPEDKETALYDLLLAGDGRANSDMGYPITRDPALVWVKYAREAYQKVAFEKGNKILPAVLAEGYESFQADLYVEMCLRRQRVDDPGLLLDMEPGLEYAAQVAEGGIDLAHESLMPINQITPDLINHFGFDRSAKLAAYAARLPILVSHTN